MILSVITIIAIVACTISLTLKTINVLYRVEPKNSTSIDIITELTEYIDLLNEHLGETEKFTKGYVNLMQSLREFDQKLEESTDELIPTDIIISTHNYFIIKSIMESHDYDYVMLEEAEDIDEAFNSIFKKMTKDNEKIKKFKKDVKFIKFSDVNE